MGIPWTLGMDYTLSFIAIMLMKSIASNTWKLLLNAVRMKQLASVVTDIVLCGTFSLKTLVVATEINLIGLHAHLYQH